MTLLLNLCGNPAVEKLLREHNYRPMKAFHEVLKDKAKQGIELPMAIIMDQRCGIERRVEEADGLKGRYFRDVLHLVGASALILAVDEGRLDVAKALLAAGADPNAKGSDGGNSLLVATGKGNLEAIESLISYGADINAVDNDGQTPLHYVLNGTDFIELLLRSGANLEAVDNEGWTPLHNAAFACDAGCVKALLRLGANQAAVDDEGRTPLHCAAEFHDIGVTVFSVKVIEAFRYNVAAFEANLTAVDKDAQTPLHLYVSGRCGESGNREIRALLTPE